MHKVDLFEDFLKELNRANQNDKALVVNSIYVVHDEKQRYEALLRKELSEIDEEFDSLQP